MLMKAIVIIALCFVEFCLTEKQSNESKIAEKLYTKLFKRQRAEQNVAIKNFLKINSYEKKYEMIMLMAEKVFTVIQDSRAILEASPYIPGVSKFPIESKIRDALSNILENTALISEIILRSPDIAVSVLKTNNNWNLLLQWGVFYCHQVEYLLDNSTIKLLNLVSQELNHIPRKSDFINPYRMKQEVDETEMAMEKKVKRKKKVLKKGPRLSSHDEF